jgi:hypothetical protein
MNNKSITMDKNITDLDLIVEKWINYMWEKTKSMSKSAKQQPQIEFEDLEIIVNWKKVDILQDDAVFKDDKSISKKLNQQTLFRTYFTNETEQEQEYSFKTERKTRQSCSFSFVKGFSREKEGQITFKLPYEIVEIGAGLKTEQSVEYGRDQTNEEEISWGVDSLIKVSPLSKTTAELVINELELVRDFHVVSYFKGRLSVCLNLKKDNTFVKSLAGDIVQILAMAADKHWIIMETNRVQFIRLNGGTEVAKMESSGKCNIRLGVEQHINLKDEKLF